MRFFRKIYVVFVAAVLCWGASLVGAPTAEQRAEILAVTTLLTKAGNLYREQKFAEAGEIVKQVQERIEKLAGGGDEQALSQLEPTQKRLGVAHDLLKTKGITLPELKPLPMPAAVVKTKAKAAGKKGAKGPAATVSFVKQVAPILNARCGNCHVRNARGMFSMATFASLMQGPRNSGKVIFPGDAKGSVLIEKVQEKEMPPSGAGIPTEELETLKKWVEEGANFDGGDPSAQLVSLLPAGSQPPPMLSVTAQAATGSETVSFAKDIAPVLIANCTGCHGTNNPRANLNVNTVAGLFRGGDSGPPILPGKPSDSLIIKMLKGTVEGKPRMPNGRPALDSTVIAKFEKWIEEGAKFDGPNTGAPLPEVVALVKAQNATHEELSADRAKLAEENWRLGIPASPPNRSESSNFLVLGSVGENTLAEIAKKAEALAPKVAEVFRAPRQQPLVKGRMTLYVFSERYDYGEFGKMVEKRDLPTSWRGHYRHSIVDAYGAVVTPRSDDYSLDALIGQQLGAVHVAALGRGVPHWFAEGCGRVVAARLAGPSEARVRSWDEELSGALGLLAKPDDFLTDKLRPEQADVCSFSFVKFLMGDARKFQNLLEALRKGGEFAKSFSEAYGGTPNQLAAAWARNPPGAKRR